MVLVDIEFKNLLRPTRCDLVVWSLHDRSWLTWGCDLKCEDLRLPVSSIADPYMQGECMGQH